MSILQTTELKKYYGSKPNITKALDGVTLSIEDGEFVAIVGTSGSGKSTLLNMMGGLDRPTSGSIEVKGKELSKLKDEQLTIFRRRNIGFIFQNYNLVPVLNAAPCGRYCDYFYRRLSSNLQCVLYFYRTGYSVLWNVENTGNHRKTNKENRL